MEIKNIKYRTISYVQVSSSESPARRQVLIGHLFDDGGILPDVTGKIVSLVVRWSSNYAGTM